MFIHKQFNLYVLLVSNCLPIHNSTCMFCLFPIVYPYTIQLVCFACFQMFTHTQFNLYILLVSKCLPIHNLTCMFGVFSDAKVLDDYIQHYDELNYNTDDVHNAHLRHKRSADSAVHIHLQAFSR